MSICAIIVSRRIYKEWSFQVIPNLGHIVAGDRDSYQVR